MLEIYLDPCTVNSRKVLAGLQLLEVPYHFNFIDYFVGQHKSPPYTAINPHATVPAATDGPDLTLTESNAILQYAADLANDGKGHSAYPKDLKKRADINRWLLWETSTWFPSCYVYLVEYVVKPLLKTEPDQKIIDSETPKWQKMATILDERLAKTGKWLTGDEVSIADIAVAAPMHLHAAQRLPLDKFLHLRRWLSELENLECWRTTQGAVDKALLPESAAANETNTVISANGVDGGHKDVRATFNYTKDVAPKLTELYFYETEKAMDVHSPGDDPREMDVRDGWYRAGDFSVDKEGFSLHDFHTQFEQWEEEELVKQKFYPEIVEWLKKEQGAKSVLVFDHTIRTQKNAAKKLTQESNTSQRTPVMLVHCDYTAESGPTRVKQLLPDEADALLSKRVAFFNVWKPIHHVVEENPLAMCDVTSSPPDDFFKLHLRYRDRNGENYVMRHSDSHKWWYFPQMTTEKVVLLKTFDSETNGRARFVGHSAFADPTSREGAPMRESVEIRTIAFF